jgi:hypothetical protein
MVEVTATLPPKRDNPDIDQDLPGGANDGDRAWLTLAEQAFRMSTDYMDANLRRQWERNVSNLMGVHPQGSKYHGNDYRRRSRLFRPKTRAAERDFEAAIAVAFFSSHDVATVETEHANKPLEVAGAKVGHYLLNHHLTKTVPWFKTVVGAAQDAWTYGIVWSEQSWEYKKDHNGKVVKDHPTCRLIPVENMRVDSACNWVDPVGSSPYLIEILPMYITDVIDKMNQTDDRTGQSAWAKLTMGELQSARRIEHEDDSTRMAREGRFKRDRMDNNHEVTAYDIIWVHKNIIDVRGRDYFYYTAGTQYMLTQPVPLDEVYPDGRPYVLGNVVIDTHRVNPSSVANLSQDLQSQANSIANQRIDNVELAMNSRYLVDRASGTDREALKRSAPGVAVLTDDIDGVHELKFSDVTRSSYEEQDRLNMDFDDITGSFSTSSVGSNRQLNETVGGMNLMSQGSDVLTEFQIRVFTETWYELVVGQILKLIQRYETDQRVLALAAESAQLFQKFGVDQVTDKILTEGLSTTISVGFSATNPEKRSEKLRMALDTVGPYLRPGELDRAELSKEVFGAAGYRDGLRFVNIPPPGEEPPQQPSPEQIQAEAEMKMLEMTLADKEADRVSKQAIAELDLKTKTVISEHDMELQMIKMASQENMTVAQIKSKYQINKDNIANDERKVAIDVALKKQDKEYDPGQRLGG